MKYSMWMMVLVVLVSVSGSVIANEMGEVKEKGFVKLFDGKSLKGWRVSKPKMKKAWVVRDGVIVGDGNKGVCYLVTERADYVNFELKLKYRFDGKANSGIGVRVRKDKTGKREFQSYHADLGHVGNKILGEWDFHTPSRKEHACHRGKRLVIDEHDRPTVTDIKDALTFKDVKKGGWNEVHLVVKENRFQFYVNGKLASEFTEHLPKEKRLLKGAINLQIHDPGMVVRFKDIRIKELKK